MAEIISTYHQTPRIKTHVLQRVEDAAGETILFIHGNGSSSIFWKELMSQIPSQYNVIAPDLRGYGLTEDKLIDATRGFSDQLEDVVELMEQQDISNFHVVGHSMGGGLVYELLAQHGEKLLSATLVNPVSPFGFGGTKNADGEPVWDDFSGTGGGVANPEFARRIKEQDRTEEDPNASPRVVMNSFYWKAPFIPNNIEELLDGLLQQKIGDQKYPGDYEKSENWPFIAPGKWGPVNAASPKYLTGLVDRMIEAEPKTKILWVRGSDDKIVSNNSLFDMATLGKLGFIPDYPGEGVYPPQPMIEQTRFVLKNFEAKGGSVREIEMEGTGHSPFIEKPELFLNHFLNFINGEQQ